MIRVYGYFPLVFIDPGVPEQIFDFPLDRRRRGINSGQKKKKYNKRRNNWFEFSLKRFEFLYVYIRMRVTEEAAAFVYKIYSQAPLVP